MQGNVEVRGKKVSGHLENWSKHHSCTSTSCWAKSNYFHLHVSICFSSSRPVLAGSHYCVSMQ